MKIKKDFILRKVADSYVVVPVGKLTLDFNGIINLNETGAFIWNKLAEKDCTEADLVDALLEEYELTREVAECDVHKMVEDLKKYPVLIK